VSSITAPMGVSREPVRRHLSVRQAETVARLTEAAVDEVRSTGYDGLTVRNVAKRAGVAPATAYTYFSSKDHLVAEVFWRRLQTQVPTEAEASGSTSAPARVALAIGDVAGIVGDDPELASAVTSALLASDIDAARVRNQIGLAVTERLRQAMGPDLDEARLEALQLALWGAMLSAGMGAFPHGELAERMGRVITIVLGDGAGA
jgi:AcrR family transcriptional regulator